MDHEIICPAFDDAGTEEIDVTSSDISFLSSFSMWATNPGACPAPTTATTRVPGELYILDARYWSRSSIRTRLTVGNSFAMSSSIDCSTLVSFNRSSSSLLISSLENTAVRREDISLSLFHKLERRQARLNVTWISRSHRERGIFLSDAKFAARMISSPGDTPIWVPSFFWYDDRAMFASIRNPLFSLSIVLILRFSQPWTSVLER